MRLKVLGSSSRGNGYILSNDTEALILEAGVPTKTLLEGLDYKVGNVVGCLVTHRHGDHSKYLTKYKRFGFVTLAIKDVWESTGLGIGRRNINVIPGQWYKVGGFLVQPFNASHDVPCVGWVIKHSDIGKMVFLTDSFMCAYNIKGLNHILVECNYSMGNLVKAINEGRTMEWQKDRLMQSHMSLDACRSLLKRWDLSEVHNILLLHLSHENSDKDSFVDCITKDTGKLVYAAESGLELELTI